jgi:hypothetical protein
MPFITESTADEGSLNALHRSIALGIEYVEHLEGDGSVIWPGHQG